MPQLAQRIQKYGTTIFTEINNLAAQYDTVNLGQGKPDFDSPPGMVQAAVAAFQSGEYSQYAPGFGAPALRAALAEHIQRVYGYTPDTDGGIIVTCGATEAIYAAIAGSIDPGDEVIVIEPFYDIYVPSIEMAGGVPVYVPLTVPGWTLDPAALRTAFSEKTRAIVINTPNNPTGRTFTRSELEAVAALCVAFDALCIVDAVYEHLTYDEAQHISVASLPGMADRTLTIGSVAKTYSATGWKIGWMYGDPHIITGAWRAHQLMAFAVNHPSQIGAAHALRMPASYYDELRAMYRRKRDLLLTGLDAAGLTYTQPDGAFYVLADFSGVFDGDDVAFARHLIEQIGVAAIPPSAFYSKPHKHLAQHYIRFAYCKTDETLERACERLARLRKF
jgi:N-succinyldiaminopimelate aminotransferase